MEKFKKICLKSIDILAVAVFALIFFTGVFYSRENYLCVQTLASDEKYSAFAYIFDIYDCNKACV